MRLFRTRADAEHGGIVSRPKKTSIGGAGMTSRQGVFRGILAAAALLQTIVGTAPIVQAVEPRCVGRRPTIQRRLIGREATR